MQTDNLELKKLVYLYLMNYAKSQPDMAIMAVNSFVKVTCSPGMSGKGPAQWLPAHLCPSAFGSSVSALGLDSYKMALNPLNLGPFYHFFLLFVAEGMTSAAL